MRDLAGQSTTPAILRTFELIRMRFFTEVTIHEEPWLVFSVD